MTRLSCENGYVDYYEEDGEIIIDMVSVISKRNGTGTALINRVLEYAAENNIETVSLCAYPQDDSIDLDSLISFYEKLGFSEDYNDGNEALMSISL